MINRWVTIKTVSVLLSIATCSAAAIEPRTYSSSPGAIPPLCFGQSMALSDFDADGLIDQADVANWGVYRTVKVVLSGTHKPLILRFDNGGVCDGSLFAQDIDDDGAADLIWTDLLHSESVVVWLGNGKGEFERVPTGAYAIGYTLPDKSVSAPDVTIRETSIGSATNPEETRNSTGQTIHPNTLPQQRFQNQAFSSPFLGEPADRGPPTPLQ